MRTYRPRLLMAAAILAAFTCMSQDMQAKDYGVFVNGSYSPSSAGTTQMDNMTSNRVTAAKVVFDRRHPTGGSAYVDSSSGLDAAIKAIDPCTCNDTITIVMMGHGSKTSFKFSKEPSSTRSLNHKTLKDWLEAAAKSCCCKIHIVIFSCHSGSYLTYLFEGKHIKSGYASSKGNEKSWGDGDWGGGTYVDRSNDWMNAFIKDWDAAPTNSIEVDLGVASLTARSEMPPEVGDKQHPEGWSRGTNQVRAHVESVRNHPSGPPHAKVEMHVWDPPALRCRTLVVNYDKDDPNAPSGLKKCDWITTTVVTDKPTSIGTKHGAVPVGPVDPTNKPADYSVSRVTGIDVPGSAVSVQILKPYNLEGLNATIDVQLPGQIGTALQIGDWVAGEFTIVDPTGGDLSTTQHVEPSDQVFNVKAGIAGAPDLLARTVPVNLLEPLFLFGEPAVIQVEPGEAAKLDFLGPPTNIWCDFHSLTNVDGFHPASNLETVVIREGDVLAHVADSGLDAAPSPELSTEIDIPVEPALRVRNMGVGPVLAGLASCSIWNEGGIPVYSDTMAVPPLDVFGTEDLTFLPWTPMSTGNYLVSFELLPADDNDYNNTLSLMTTVVPSEEINGTIVKIAALFAEPNECLGVTNFTVDIGTFGPGSWP